MSVWDTYEKRVTVQGKTNREVSFNREAYFLNKKMKDSLSYHAAIVDGIEREVAIINSDNLNEKVMLSKPGEDFECGKLVEWMNNFWLINEKDANNELYTRVKLLQCNFLLHWVDLQGVLHEQWCVIEDGTKYLTGEIEDRHFVVTRGDSRIAMHIGRNEYTKQFGREFRFLVDEPGGTDMLAYALTKPLKVGHTYADQGIYSFVLQEVVNTDDDNFELGVADYYKYFPKKEQPKETAQSVDDKYNTETNRKKVWL